MSKSKNNSQNCPKCNNSPWIQRARNFINQNQNVQQGTNKYYQVEAVNYLLNNGHCGIDCRVRINNVMEGINYPKSREDFQQEVLIPLKKEGIVATLVNPGPQGGVFIPCNEDEIKEVARQLFERIESELENLEGSATGVQNIEKLANSLKTIVSRLKNTI